MLLLGRYCCLVVIFNPEGGLIVKWPPLSLSNIRQKTDGESKSGLQSINGWIPTSKYTLLTSTSCRFHHQLPSPVSKMPTMKFHMKPYHKSTGMHIT